jgi:hypothetical protein
LLDAARDPSVTLYVTSQILCEFYSVITNRAVWLRPHFPPKPWGIISALLALPRVGGRPQGLSLPRSFECCRSVGARQEFSLRVRRGLV